MFFKMKNEGMKTQLYFAEVNSNIFREWNYKEKAKYSVAKRNIFYDSMNEIEIPTNNEVHLSVYSYTNSILQNKSIAKYTGSTFANYVHIVFEKKEINNMQFLSSKIKKFLNETEEVYKIPVEAWHLFYTGNSGYQLSIISNWFKAEPLLEFYDKYKLLVMQLTKDYKDSINYNVCNKNSLLLAPNSINTKTQLYKIPLYYKELDLNELAIRELSKKQRIIEYPDVDIKVNKQLSELFKSYKPKS